MKKVQKLANEIRGLINNEGNHDGGLHSTDLIHIDFIKEILNKHSPIEKPFPKLMTGQNDDGLVVYFSNFENGIVVVSGCTEYYVGEESFSWDNSEFKDCNIGIIE